MAIRITEDGTVIYENEPNVTRELFPNAHCCADIRTEVDELKENLSESVGDLKSALPLKMDLAYDWEEEKLTIVSGVMSASGVINAGAASFTHCVYTRDNQSVVAIRVTGTNLNGSYPLVVFLDSNDIPVGNITLSSNTAYTGYMLTDIPVNCTKIVVNNNKNDAGVNSRPYVETSKTVINGQKLFDEKADKELSGWIKKGTVVAGLMSYNGSISTASASWKHCVYNIEEKDGLMIAVTGSNMNDSYPLVIYLDESNNPVGTVILTANTAYNQYILNSIPATAKQVVVNNAPSITSAPLEPAINIQYYYSLYSKMNKEYGDWEDTNSAVEAGVMSTSGTINTGASSFKHCAYDIENDSYLIAVTGVNLNSSFPLALFLDGNDTVIGSVVLTDGTVYTNYMLNQIPSACKKIVVNNQSSVTGAASLPSISIKRYITARYLNDRIGEYAELKNTNFWKNKKIVWFGTSIPAGVVNDGGSGGNGAYPTRIGKMLGATIYNESVGASCVRAGNFRNVSEDDPLGLAGMQAPNLVRSLSLSSTEKEEIFNEWDSKWKNVLANSSHVGMTQADKTNYKNTSWDIKLAKYLTGGSVGPVDLYVFDHGHNEQGYPEDWTEEFLCAEPPTNDQTSRAYWIGAFAFIVKKILEDNPKARICIIGHYENDRKPGIAASQLLLANKWKFPICKTWEMIGLSQNQIAIDGTTKTITNWWFPDNLHPASDLTGKALQHYAETLYPFMRDVR